MANYSFSRTPQIVPQVNTQHRKIVSQLPCPGTEQILADLDQFESRSMHGQYPLIWDHAQDFYVFDRCGNQWIDFTSTIFVTNTGHANPRVIHRLKELLDQNLLHTYAYPNEIRAQYLKKLIAFTEGKFEKAFLLSAGTEATEAALKLMRMNGQKNGKRKLGIISLERNWHGRTMGAQMMSGNLQQKEWIGYHDPNMYHIPFPYPWALQGKSGEAFFHDGMQQLKKQGIDFQHDLCGIMLETFQGWGAIFYPVDFVQAAAHFCQQHGLLLTFDEMQAGFARTGKAFGYEHYGVTADLICCGKGMGSGLPLSGVLGSAQVMDLPEVGNMSSTHSANPLVCAAGLATLEEIQEKNLITETTRKGELFFTGLQQIQAKYPHRISYVLGKGLIAAILFKSPQDNTPDFTFTSKVAERCIHKGLLVVHTGIQSIKMGPPLTISDDALREALGVLDEAIAECDTQL